MNSMSSSWAGRSKIAIRFSPSTPCPVCGHGTKGCSATDDGLYLCRGETSAPLGWMQFGGQDNAGFYHYRRQTDPLPKQPKRQPKSQQPKRQDNDWPAIAKKYIAAISEQQKAALAEQLGLPKHCLEANDIGWDGSAWTFPERNANREIIGLGRRFLDGSKGFHTGGNRGLIIPNDWQLDDSRPLVIAEGPSDVLAGYAINWSMLGRPSNVGGIEYLALLLSLVPKSREIIIFGENDHKPNGDWPGRYGAEKVANQLAMKLGRPIKWALPPDDVKDLRAWVISQAGDEVVWSELGQYMLRSIMPSAVTVTLSDLPSPLATVAFSDLQIAAIHWLIEGYIPAGMLTLFAGNPGLGKSFITVHLAACITKGLPIFDDDEAKREPADVLFITVEDDPERVVLPRLIACGADLSRVHLLKGVRTEDGKTASFTLLDVQNLHEHLRQHPEIKLVVIDPVVAFLGGVDDHKDAELRQLLGPLGEVAMESGAAILMVKHLNRRQGVRALDRVSGSIAYGGTVRTAFSIVPDPDNADRRVFLPMKTNIGPLPKGRAYRIIPVDPEAAKRMLEGKMSHLPPEDQNRVIKGLAQILWDGIFEGDADELLDRASKCDQSATTKSRVEECAEFITNFLAVYQFPSTELETAGKTAGFKFATIKRAKESLKAQGKLHNHKDGLTGTWWVGLLPLGEHPRRPDGNTRTPQECDTPLFAD